MTGRSTDATMPVVDFAAALASTFNQRRSVNRRYSLRAFAHAIGVSHSAASRLINRRQRPSAATIRTAGDRLRWTPAQVAALIRIEHVERLAAAAASPRFTADARLIASRTNLALDDLQIALHEALRTGRLEMTTMTQWRVMR